MPEQETYPRAPIVEAVLDVKVRLSSPFTEELMNELRAIEQTTYPGFRRPFQVQFKVERTDPLEAPAAEVSSQVNGGAMVSQDGLQLFQARPDGFSHNRLAPYKDWVILARDGVFVEGTGRFHQRQYVRKLAGSWA